MTNRPCVIIHGWSDNKESFTALAQMLHDKSALHLTRLYLADYISEDDDVTYNDLVSALSHAWRDAQLPTTPGSVDVIVHSTGGLIIRQWIVDNYHPHTVPIKHLVMLAPANFGSPLAHKGLSFYGRIIKGLKTDKPFQVGSQLLKGLELASPYSFQLALKDRFGPLNYYGPGAILCTVLIGNTGYSGLEAIANGEGDDGTVRASGANMDAALLTADFSTHPQRPTYHLQEANGMTAFALMAGENHTTITGNGDGFKNPATLATILQALQIDDAHFSDWRLETEKANAAVSFKRRFQNPSVGFQDIVLHATNQYGDAIADYFVASYQKQTTADTAFVERFHQEIVRMTHTYQDDASYRSLYVDYSTLSQQVTEYASAPFYISVTANPVFQQDQHRVGYSSFLNSTLGAIELDTQNFMQLFAPNRTLLVKLALRREQASQLLQITPDTTTH